MNTIAVGLAPSPRGPGWVPGRRSVPLKVGQAASVLFGRAYILQPGLVTVNPQSPPSQPFVNRAKRATERALEAYPPAIRQALLDAGFKVVVSRQNGAAVERLDQVFNPGQVFEYRMTMQEHGQFMPRLAAAFANLPLGGSGADLMEVATEQALLSFLKPELDGKPAFVGHQPPVIYLAETITGPKQAAWNHYARSTRRLAHVVLHESGHVMDVALGAARTGRPFSQSPEFKALLLADLKALPPQDPSYAALRQPNRMGEDGNSYFPLEGSQDPQKLGESFAELTAARYGQGALRRGDVLNVFSRHTLPYLQAQVWNQIALAT